MTNISIRVDSPWCLIKMSIGHLHDDLLLYLTKSLSANDCLSLAISGANERFSFLYGYNR